MEKIILDFSNCQHWSEFHQMWKKTLDFPDYYGENWDALWDCINYLFDEPTLLEFHGVTHLDRKFGDDVSKMLVRLLDDVHEETPWVIYRIVS